MTITTPLSTVITIKAPLKTRETIVSTLTVLINFKSEIE